MKPEALWWLMGLLVLRDGAASDYGEEEKIGKAGYCPPSPGGLYQPPCTVECEADSECPGTKKCCEFACRYSCVLPSPEKPGICPSPLMKKLQVPLEPCVTTCRADQDCSGPQKCCGAACGQTCRLPLLEKPGKCPKKKPQKDVGRSTDTCLHDQECLGTEKCCFSGSSMNCVDVQPGRTEGAEGSQPGKKAGQGSPVQNVLLFPNLEVATVVVDRLVVCQGRCLHSLLLGRSASQKQTEPSISSPFLGAL